jgi:hypothetical protein
LTANLSITVQKLLGVVMRSILTSSHAHQPSKLAPRQSIFMVSSRDRIRQRSFLLSPKPSARTPPPAFLFPFNNVKDPIASATPPDYAPTAAKAPRRIQPLEPDFGAGPEFGENETPPKEQLRSAPQSLKRTRFASTLGLPRRRRSVASPSGGAM